jgi:hypothetical protein
LAGRWLVTTRTGSTYRLESDGHSSLKLRREALDGESLGDDGTVIEVLGVGCVLGSGDLVSDRIMVGLAAFFLLDLVEPGGEPARLRVTTPVVSIAALEPPT